MAAPVSLGQVNTLEVRRGASRVIRLSPERDGDPVIFTSIAVEVHDSGGAVAQSGAATVNPTTGIATYTILAATTEDVDIDTTAQGWEVVWTCTLAGEDEVLVHREPLDVVLYAPQPQVVYSTLTDRHGDLEQRLGRRGEDPGAAAQKKITEAWNTLLGMLRQKGRRPSLIVDSVALRQPHLLLSLELIWRDLASGGQGSPEWQYADDYAGKFQAAWDATTFETADPSTYDRTLQRDGARPSGIWRTAPGRFRRTLSGAYS